MAQGTDIKLRTVGDLVDAGEWMFNKQRKGELDAKSADGMNTTMKGQTYLVVKLPMDVVKLYVMAKKSKIELPPSMFPAGLLNPSDLGAA